MNYVSQLAEFNNQLCSMNLNIGEYNPFVTKGLYIAKSTIDQIILMEGLHGTNVEKTRGKFHVMEKKKERTFWHFHHVKMGNSHVTQAIVLMI